MCNQLDKSKKSSYKEGWKWLEHEECWEKRITNKYSLIIDIFGDLWINSAKIHEYSSVRAAMKGANSLIQGFKTIN